MRLTETAFNNVQKYINGEKIASFKRDREVIPLVKKFIENPTEEWALEIVRNNRYNIDAIENPTQTVKDYHKLLWET
jgi:hypothetical protein